MKDKVLTIDLKNRTYGNSIILDVTFLDGEGDLRIDLDLRGALQNIKNSIRDGYIEESEKTVRGIEPFFETHRSHELFNEYNGLKKVSNHMFVVMENSNKRIGLEEYLEIRDTYRFFLNFREGNDISYFEYTYNNVVEKLSEFLEEYDLMELIQEIKDSIKSTDNISYVAYVIDKIKKSDICGQEEVMVLEALEGLKEELNDFRSKTLDKYNNKLGTISSIKALVPYEYKKLINDKNFKIYIKTLKKSYDDYEELKNDFNLIYKLYILNNSRNYVEFYRNLMELSVGYFQDFCNLNGYYREYVSRNVFKLDKKYYSIDSIADCTNEIINNLSIDDSGNILHI